jgi:hypothetical protein
MDKDALPLIIGLGFPFLEPADEETGREGRCRTPQVARPLHVLLRYEES